MLVKATGPAYSRLIAPSFTVALISHALSAYFQLGRPSLTSMIRRVTTGVMTLKYSEGIVTLISVLFVPVPVRVIVLLVQARSTQVPSES